MKQFRLDYFDDLRRIYIILKNWFESFLIYFKNVQNYHGTWDTATGFNAPLYARTGETGQDKNFNVDAGVNYWISKGFPAQKIVVFF